MLRLPPLTEPPPVQRRVVVAARAGVLSPWALAGATAALAASGALVAALLAWAWPALGAAGAAALGVAASALPLVMLLARSLHELERGGATWPCRPVRWTR